MSLQKKLGIIDFSNYTVSNYAISNYGNVKNIKTDKILKPYIDSMGYRRVDLFINNKKYVKKVHRLVLTTFENNPENKKCIDHIDNDRSNNELFNLRFVTHQQNNFNKSMRIDNTSGTKGVYYCKRYKKWCAQIRINRKHIHIGYYENIEDAIKARQDKSKELFGEYLNSCEK